MKIKEAIDFETFYYHSLLENIIKKSQDKLPESLQQSIQNFVDFLSSETSPLSSIEKLAHLQGTSDLSIFFSDLIERLSEYHPDDAIQNMDEYARDFLEIYKELAKDQEWQRVILGELLGRTEEQLVPTEELEGLDTAENESVDFYRYIYQELEEVTRRVFEEKAAGGSESVGTLFNRIKNYAGAADSFGPFHAVPQVSPIISAWDKLYRESFDPEALETYRQEFKGLLEEFAESLLTLFQEDENLFLAFCTGKEPEISEMTASEELDAEMGDLIQSIESIEEQRVETEELTDEDRNLRWLLRDYIQHEIEELGREINEYLENTASGESQTIILDNFKVLKDLGQIHKYPLIEKVSGEIGVTLKQFFREKSELPMASRSSIQNILKSFSDYIDAVLEGTEESHVDTITKLKDNFTESIAVTARVESEVEFEDKENIQKIFSEVSGRYLDHIRENFQKLIQNPGYDELKAQILAQVGHLKFWFVVLKLSGGENILEVFQNWLRNPQQQEKLIKKQHVLLDTLQALRDKLFQITPDEWTRYMEELTRLGKAPQEVGVDKSWRAFTDVTGREISKLLSEIENKDVTSTEFFENLHQTQSQNYLSCFLQAFLLPLPQHFHSCLHPIEQSPCLQSLSAMRTPRW